MKHESYLLFCAMIKCTNEPVALNKQFQLTSASYVLVMPCGYIPNNLSQYFLVVSLSFWQHFSRMLYLKAIRNRFKGLVWRTITTLKLSQCIYVNLTNYTIICNIAFDSQYITLPAIFEGASDAAIAILAVIALDDVSMDIQRSRFD